jgi:hypothetical protein
MVNLYPYHGAPTAILARSHDRSRSLSDADPRVADCVKGDVQ